MLGREIRVFVKVPRCDTISVQRTCRKVHGHNYSSLLVTISQVVIANTLLSMLHNKEDGYLAQSSAVSVSLGLLDLRCAYFLHGAGVILHMLIIAWRDQS
jgi:hypothetical protein